jgi:Tfp pilus assembly protein FimV
VSEKLINSLKDDAVAHSASTKESRELRKKVQSQTAEISALQTQVAQLTASVAQAQSEKLTLSAKLAANRTCAAENASTKAPGTAVKPNGIIRVMAGADAAAQLKENLYSDLTGLIIRSVKQESEDDVFDCIQTGRNGRGKFPSHGLFQLIAD